MYIFEASCSTLLTSVSKKSTADRSELEKLVVSDFKTDYMLTTIIHKIFETNSSFHVKKRTTGKVPVLFFRKFLLILTKFLFREEDWALGNYSIKFDIFLMFSNISPRLIFLKTSNLALIGWRGGTFLSNIWYTFAFFPYSIHFLYLSSCTRKGLVTFPGR